MRIVMLETHRGSEDGFVVRCFLKHQAYEVADTLARAFIHAGWGREAVLFQQISASHLSGGVSMPIYDPYLSRNPLTLARNRLLTRTTAPASEPVTLAEAKLYLRIDGDEEDDLVGDLIVAARMIAEGWLKRSLITQSWKLCYDDGIPDSIHLPMGPVGSITSVVVVNQDGSSQTMANTSYWLDAGKTSLVMNSALMGFRIEITYVTGYGNAAAVPSPIKQGILAHIAAMYDHRGQDGTSILPEQTVGLYVPFREVAL